jgi:hypothetical protein
MKEFKPGIGQEPIHRLIASAVEGKIDIPEFQRDFVWTKNQVADLFDSLIKGYPIGSILIWDISNYTEGRHIYENVSKEWVVDGQQRIVALCILSSKKPYWLDTSLWNDLLRKYKIKVNILTLEVSLEYPAIRHNPEWVYPYEIFNSTDLGSFGKELSERMHRQELFTKIYDNCNRIKSAIGIDVPIIKINTSLENVATIFERINSAGTRVKQADITLAYIAAYNRRWIREEFTRYVEDLDNEGFYFDPTLIIRAITAIGEDKARLKEVKEDFLRNKNGTLDNAFARFKRSLSTIIQNFREVGILSSELIYAKNTIIPHIYMHNKFDDQFEFKKALLIFLLSLWRGRYSGSAETTLQEDINIIKQAADFGVSVERLFEQLGLPEISKDTIKSVVHYQGDGRFFKLLLYMIAYQNKAVDWFTNVRLGYTRHNEINREFSIEEHHFFPRSLLRGIGIEKEQRELLANITFVNPGTNRKLRHQPYTYIQTYNIDKKELEKQLIPLDENLWKIENYEEFIEIRSEIITNEINKYIRSLYPRS